MPEHYCPNCESEVSVEEHDREEVYSVRGEQIPVRSRVLICSRCGEDLSDPERDEETLRRAYDEYRRRRGLLFPEDIRCLRQRYGLSQRQLARLLGWGLVTVQRYEKGALQDAAHDLLLRQLEDPEFILRLAASPRADLSVRERGEIQARISQELGESRITSLVETVEQMVTSDVGGDSARSGFRRFNLSRFGHVMQTMVARLGGPVFKTKLAKLMWLSDFLHFAECSISITGAVYARLPYGPAPHRYPFLLASLEELGMIVVQVEEAGKHVGDVVQLAGPPQERALGASELSAIERVARRYGAPSSTELSELSHQERIWVERADGDIIPYTEAIDVELIRGFRR